MSISKLKVKFIVESTVVNGDDVMDVEEISNDRLILKRPIGEDFLSSCKKCRLYFHIGGKWRAYQMYNLLPVLADTNGIKAISFDIDNEQKAEFLRDFSLARMR